MENIDLRLKLFGGFPVFVEGFGEIRPLTSGEIIKFGYTQYVQCLRLVCLELDDLFEDASFLKEKGIHVLDALIVYGDDDMRKELEQSMSLFLDGEAIIDDDILSIIIQKGNDDFCVVSRNNFDDIREIIKWQNYINHFDSDGIDSFNPVDEATRELKQRMDELKKKKEEIKRKRGSSDGDSPDIDFFDIVSSVASKSYGVNELNVLDLTVYQVYYKFKKLDIIEEYDISIKSILAGGKDVKIKHWSTKVE